jgi:hypothetical protein
MIGGRTLYENLDGLFRSGQYKAARAKMESGNLADYTTYVAVNMVKRRIEPYEKAANARMLQEFPEVRRAIEEKKRRKTYNRYGVQGPNVPGALVQAGEGQHDQTSWLDEKITESSQMVLAAGGLIPFFLTRGRYREFVKMFPTEAAKFKEAAMGPARRRCGEAHGGWLGDDQVRLA